MEKDDKIDLKYVLLSIQLLKFVKNWIDLECDVLNIMCLCW